MYSYAYLWCTLICVCRCIRPNELKSPNQFQPDKVLVQLRYTGVLETIRIRKEGVCVCVCVCVNVIANYLANIQGFSHRVLFHDFILR